MGDGGVVGVGDDVGHAASDYEHDHFAWQQRFDTTQTFCFADASVCPAGTFCYEFERNPDHTPSFDSVFEAAFPMLQVRDAEEATPLNWTPLRTGNGRHADCDCPQRATADDSLRPRCSDVPS